MNSGDVEACTKFAFSKTQKTDEMLQVHRAIFNPFSENTYILYNENKDCWIIDPGMYDAEEIKYFMDFIDSERLNPKGIINTHTHIDHIFGVQALIDAYNIPFAIHPLEVPVLAGAKSAAMMFGFTMNEIPKPTQELKEGSGLMLGDDRLELRLAPGHSPGSVVFYYPEGGWAISGDVLFAGSIGRSDLPGGDHDTLIRSIRSEMLTLPDETIVYPGHGDETTVGHEKRTNPFLR